MKVQSKVVVVTGGGSGIGRELVLGLLLRGATVAAVDINQSALEETVELSGDKEHRLTTHSLDITDQGTVEALPAQITAVHGVVDGLINNAGIIQPFVGLADLDYEAIKRVINVNFLGTLYMTKAFLPHLLSRPEAHITNMSSMGGFLPFPGQTVYGASKAAVKLMTEGLSSELLSTNVRVTVVFPGAVGSNIADNSGVEISPETRTLQRVLRPLAPSKAAKIIIDGIEKNRYRVLVGSDAVFMDFIYRLSPRRSVRLISRLTKSLLLE